ncbi:hypothetical protein GCM10023220_43500 [Streptomyces ziwulingensis]|uniref:Uncharacterized protein n=1 Tax=Streptomyces ziwulingensis TaxID=1045501 RepID=A0ABP9CCG3_9ACTN
MFRRIRDGLVRRRPRDSADLGEEVRTPDPYVWRLPDLREARWRRWHRRCRAAGRYLPFPLEETQPQAPMRPLWRSEGDDVVRPYVLRP